MTIVDRYLFALFLKTFLVCFLSFAGLFVVVVIFANSDEFQIIAEREGWQNIFVEFFGPRIAEMFDKTAGILTLAAAVFSVSMLQRRREMTAIEASGISKARILRPIFMTALIIVGLTIANRELVIPKVKQSLVRTPQTWGDQGNVDLTVQEDTTTGVVVRGDQLVLDEKKITDANVQLPIAISQRIPMISAKWAVLEPETSDHPAGIRMHQVSSPKDLLQVPSLGSEETGTIVYSPSEHNWLGERQCFVACNFDMEQMAYGNKLVNYLSTSSLIKEAQKPRRWYGGNHQVSIHSRFVRPILDFTLLLLGLTVVIGSIERNVFVSVGICFWIVAMFQCSIFASQFLGNASLVQPAALAAWLPALIFVPMAAVTMRKLVW